MFKDRFTLTDHYKRLHDDLSASYYGDKENFLGGKESFDAQHALIWKDLDDDLINHIAIKGEEFRRGE